jgi:3-methyladenine DNA glycosylase AlkD
MTAREILAELEPLGSESYRETMARHGVRRPCFGVKISDLQKMRKRIGTDYELALALYDTGVYAAMYLAGLIADVARMTKADLRSWVSRAEGGGLPGTTVASVAAGSAFGRPLALEWIGSTKDFVAVAGWATLSCLVSVKPDAELDLAELEALLGRVERTIHKSPNDVRYAMNGFVIAVGSFVRPLTAVALQTAEKIGPVQVDVGETACEVPFAPDYIRKVEASGSLGKKRKSAKC